MFDESVVQNSVQFQQLYCRLHLEVGKTLQIAARVNKESHGIGLMLEPLRFHSDAPKNSSDVATRIIVNNTTTVA